MKLSQLNHCVILGFAAMYAGCNSVGTTVTEAGLAGVGAVAGYKLSGDKAVGAVAGGAAGFIASKVIESKESDAAVEAEKRGYDRAMNQAVKQQYWIIQNGQRSAEPDTSKLIPLTIPAQKVGGVLTNPTTEYIRVNQ